MNYEKYRNIRNADELREQTRIRVQKFRSKEAAAAQNSVPANNRFDEFWEAYPKKVSKPDAIKAWKKIEESEVDLIVADVKYRALCDAWKRDAGQFVPYPATYLRDRRWEDGTKPPITETKGDLRGGPMMQTGQQF